MTLSIPTPPAHRAGPAPAVLGAAQHGVWVTEQALSAGSAYHLSLALHLHGPLDADALDTAWDHVVRENPALAARIDADGPRLLPGPVPGLRRVDCSPGELAALRAAETAAVFGPAAGLVRATVFTTGPDRHLLLLVAHHLVFDGESKDVVVSGLSAAYRAAVGGTPRTPEPAPLAADAPAAREVTAAAAFWAERWRESAAPVLPGLLPTPGEPVAPAPGAAAGLRLDGDVHRRLADCAGALGVTRFELLAAAWHALLLRYGNPSPATAVELSTRVPGAPRRAGLHVNELPLFTRPRQQTPFAEFARAVRAELRAVYRHRPVPLGRAVRGLTPRTALCPLALGYRRRDASGPADFGPAIAARTEWTGFAGTARNIAHLQMVDGPDALELSLQYRTDAFVPGAPERLLSHFATLLDGIPAAPDTAIGDLPLLPPRERAALLADTTAAPVTARTVPALFAARAAAAPDDVAVVDGSERLTYAELDAEVRWFAHRLRERDAGPGSLVGIALPRSAAQLVAVLGTLAAGAAYLPLDPGYPDERLEFIRADARPLVEVTGPDGTGLVPEPFRSRPGPPPPAPEPPAPGDPAYVLYTSGSTGVPKGVEVPHSALTNLLTALGGTTGAGPGDRWLGLTSLSFDISALEILLPLVTGGRVVLVPEEGHRDGAGLTALIERHGLTHVQATPSGWRLMLAAGLDAPGLVALSGGEALPAPLAAALRAAVGRLVNVYGPTETTIWSTAAEIVPGRPVTIGRPIANTRTYVLDERMRPLPVGLTGELYIGGAGVAHGYRGRPGLTAARFVPDPFGPPGGRLYRTGDLVRSRADGTLEYTGRSDSQVKIRGHRIELGEIEAVLAAVPGVDGAAVVLCEGSDGADGEPDRLVAYVVPAGRDAAPGTDELRRRLVRTLPAAAVPGAFVVLDALPLTPNGKLDRAALPAPPRTRETPPAGEAPAPAATADVTGRVLAIWRQVLELDDLGPDEDLFDVGGHSLTITSISGRIRKEFGVSVPFDVFFDSPTAHGVAACVTDLMEENQ
ncbi:non-ribosomal peptide synthetase [Streptomyces sp. t39]|uniref:non-ribosomal peptide synthetase n=1 Tax=Streptomyces sp. t39 TaxID=1828156 RepID=UPI0011CEB627|nr:amino acid adenylation domain-containing protein [Streptomyces sp. t39]TXS50013.1 non-ribosomal peptide synthetase [Streptomyces sp. t39]